ncbi:hypothetical protein BDN72DRAFT_882242 [Pluteus cervinus]|uniref:Uncharacterized protein n=1 Tax=Pluteus cervinus TaxID=181527 RepID=A0ACD3AC01_9AGAR|nr:hypothetical protein BDN72DRAFT_882242 [Pluteus cervinus]
MSSSTSTSAPGTATEQGYPPGSSHQSPFKALEFCQKAFKRTLQWNPRYPAFLTATVPWFLFNLFFLTFFLYLPNTYLHLYGAQLGLPTIAAGTALGTKATITLMSRPYDDVNTPVQWPQLSEKLKKEWKFGKDVALVLLLLNATLLQLNDVASREVTKTTTVLSWWFSFASLICGGINLIHLSPMQETYESVLEKTTHRISMFWALWVVMSLPTLFIIWSGINLAIAVVDYSFAGPSNSTSEAIVHKPTVIAVLIAIGLSLLTYLPVLVFQWRAVEAQPHQSSGNTAIKALAGNDQESAGGSSQSK